ncbi:MAG: alcohol dehydrogenase, partial [Halieaceae bacterium]
MRLFLHNLKLLLTEFVMKFITPSSYMAFVGQNSADQLCAHIGRTGVKNILIVSDKVLVELGVVEIATRAFSSFEVQLTIFDEVTPDPTFAVVAAGAELARQSGSEVVLAIGGGSSIDAAKIIAASAVSPTNPLDWVGFSKLKELPLPLFAIPTTSGTGSEATLGAVISDTESHQKFVIADPGLQP